MSLTIEELIEQAHATAVEKGWWDERTNGGLKPGRNRSLGDQFTNMHAELSEAWEVYRDGHALDERWTGKNGKPEGFCVELADVLIRLADTLGAHGLTEAFLEALETKLAYNKTRPYRHGGLKA